jgi:hypothetical protein
LKVVYAVVSEASEQRGHLEVGAWEHAGRCVIDTDVGQQAEQEQPTPARAVVDETPVGPRTLETSVDVPAGIAGVELPRKSDHEGAEVRSTLPMVGIEQLMDRIEESRGVRGIVQRLSFNEPTNYRCGPRTTAERKPSRAR